MKAVLTEERFSDPAWVYERKLDGIRCIAIKADRERPPALAQRPQPQRPLPRDRRGARGRPGDAARARRRDRRVLRRADELRAPAAARRAPRRGLPLRRSTCCTSPATTRRRCRCGRASGCCAHAVALPRPAPADAAAATRDGERALRGGLPQGLGGPDRQARRRAVHARALARLAQVQVHGRAGARDRRLHRAAGQPQRPRRAAARLLRGRPAALRRQGRHGLHARPRCATWRRGSRRCAARRSPFADVVREPHATWVEPRLVAQVGFSEWTRDGRLRHPRFLGLRDDKAAEEVVREH